MRIKSFLKRNTPEVVLTLILLGVSLSFVPAFIHPFGVFKFIVLRFGILAFLILVPLRLKSVEWHHIDLLLMIWLTNSALSALISTPWPQNIFKVEGLFLSALFYLIARTSLRDNDKFKIYVFIIILPALIQAAIGLLQYLKLFPPTSTYFLAYETQVFGTLGGANTLGAFLAISLPLVYSIGSNDLGKRRIYWILSLMLILLTLLFTKSRGAWVATVVGLIVYKWDTIFPLWKSLKSRRIMMILMLTAISGIVALLFITIYRLNPASALGRLFIWQISWDMFTDHVWTGVGIGNFGLNWLEYQGNYFSTSTKESYRLATHLSSAHSQYIHLLTETGVIGLGIFLTFVLSTLNAIRLRIRRFDTQKRHLLLTLTAALSTILTHAIIDDVLNPLIVKLQFLIILALIVSLLTEKSGKSQENLKESMNWSRLALLLMIAPLSIMSWNKINGEVLWKQGLGLARNGNWSAGISKYKDAKEHLPHSRELDFFLGAAYSKTGDARKAIELIKRSQTGMADKNQYTNLGRAYIDSKQYELAEETLRKALYYYPDLLFPHYWLSRVYFEQGDVSSAKKELSLIIDSKNTKNSQEIKQVKADARKALGALENREKLGH